MTEARYRRLLALYPRGFRREYEEEMITVLLAEARPGPGQILDLLRSALALRLRALAAPGGAWRESARVVWLFGAILLFALAVRRSGMVAVWLGSPASAFGGGSVDILRFAGWAVALAGACGGVRSLGLLGSAAGLAGEVIAPVRYYLDTPATLLNAYWLIVSAVVVLVAALLAGPEPRRVRGGVPVGLAGLALTAHGLRGYTFWTDAPWTYGPWAGDRLLWLDMLLMGVSAVLLVWGVVRQQPALRRRLVVWSTPVLVTFPLIGMAFDGLIEFNSGNPGSERLLGPVQWAAMVLIPAATFAVAAELTRRREVGVVRVSAVSGKGAEDR